MSNPDTTPERTPEKGAVDLCEKCRKPTMKFCDEREAKIAIEMIRQLEERESE